MKELSIEEKARRYDESIEKFDVILNLPIVKESGTIFVDDIRKIIPELKESEDNMIKNNLIYAINKIWDDMMFERYFDNISKKDILAWIEKQGGKNNCPNPCLKSTCVGCPLFHKSLDNKAKEVTKDKDTATSFLRSTGIIDENGELANEYRIEEDE